MLLIPLQSSPDNFPMFHCSSVFPRLQLHPCSFHYPARLTRATKIPQSQTTVHDPEATAATISPTFNSNHNIEIVLLICSMVPFKIPQFHRVCIYNSHLGLFLVCQKLFLLEFLFASDLMSCVDLCPG